MPSFGSPSSGGPDRARVPGELKPLAKPGFDPASSAMGSSRVMSAQAEAGSFLRPISATAPDAGGLGCFQEELAPTLANHPDHLRLQMAAEILRIPVLSSTWDDVYARMKYLVAREGGAKAPTDRPRDAFGDRGCNP